MPPFAADPDDASPWNLIDFIHANADAQGLTRPGEHAFAAPDFTLQCPDGSSSSLAELRGRVVHIIVAGSDTAVRIRELANTALPGLLTVDLFPAEEAAELEMRAKLLFGFVNVHVGRNSVRQRHPR